METSTSYIAIADDNHMFRYVLKKRIGDMDDFHIIIESANGKELIEKLEKSYRIPHICILDIGMPVMDGYEAIKQIRKLADTAKANTYMIAFTASVTEQEKIEQHGFNNFLYKPININELYDKLEIINLHTS